MLSHMIFCYHVALSDDNLREYLMISPGLEPSRNSIMNFTGIIFWFLAICR
jgi:hypothetical protein